MAIMKLASDLSKSTREQSSERLFLASGNISENTNVFREDVFTSSEDSHRSCVARRKSWRVWRNIVSSHFLELGQHASNFETFFEIIVLVGIDELNIFTTVEDNGVVLIVRLAISENGIA